MEISQLQIEQVPSFMKLYEAIIWTDFPDWNDESKQAWINEDYSTEFWTKALRNNQPVLVAVQDGELIGYVAVESIDFGVAYLGWIGTLTDYRGKGIATSLINELVEACRDIGIHKIELETQLPELLPFFIKQGFEMEGVRRNSWQKLDNYMFGKSI